MKRFIVMERRGRWLVVDTQAKAREVRSSHATQGLAQGYADTYNALAEGAEKGRYGKPLS